MRGLFARCAPAIAVVGLVVAPCRDARAPALFPLRLFGLAHVDIFRGVSVILVLYLIGAGVPGLGLRRPWNSSSIRGSVALVLAISAEVAEILRSCSEAIHASQRAAAASLGLNRADRMGFVGLPQAIRRVVPAPMIMLIALQKDVALRSFIGTVEARRQTGVFKSLLANVAPYVAAVIFLAVTIQATRDAEQFAAKRNRQRGRW